VDKYGYEKQDDDPKVKTAAQKGVCPACGSVTEGQPPVCPKCGSEPFEKKERDGSR